MLKSIPRVIISATGSNCGKTTVMISLLKAFHNKNMVVQSYKSGPDYIDPMFHSFITGRKTFHTDAFFSDKGLLNEIISQNSENADISIIEGAMGFYDGIGKSSDASTYTVSCNTNTPVILVIDPNGMGISVAALIKGYMNFREENHISGVILNRIKSGMYNYYREIIENETGLKVCGYLPEMNSVHLDGRHLGLMTVNEVNNLSEIVDILGDTAEKTIDLNKILEIALSASEIEYTYKKSKSEKKYVLGVALDEAFCFYYNENIDMLIDYGAEIKYFSPINDTKLPDEIDGLYFGGGYPELYLSKLSENFEFIENLKKISETGIPVFAECGGFMYLQKGIYDKSGNFYHMASLLDGTSKLGNKLCRFGYITVTAKHDCVIAQKGMSFKAHEFHYADSTNNGTDFTAKKPDGRMWDAIVSQNNITAGFPHIYFPSNPSIVKIFSNKCIKYKNEKR